MFKKENGITLVALVVTIIVLLILAGVSIAMISGDNGIATRAKDSKENTAKASAKEAVELAITTANTDYWAEYAEGNVDAEKPDEEAIKPYIAKQGYTATVSGSKITVSETGKDNATAYEFTVVKSDSGFITGVTE